MATSLNVKVGDKVVMAGNIIKNGHNLSEIYTFLRSKEAKMIIACRIRCEFSLRSSS